MKKIAVLPNVLRDVDLKETRLVISYLLSQNRTIFMEERFRDKGIRGISFLPVEKLMQEADFAVVLGGDGTILDTAVQASEYGLPLLGINLGNLGFLSQAEKGDYTVFEEIFSGKYHIMDCMMLDCMIQKEKETVARFTALNDILVSGDGFSRMVTVSAGVNDTDIGIYAADGLLTATPVGSTAYSLSAGGAILHPEMKAMILTPVCPHTLKSRSMVLKSTDVISIKQCPPYRGSAIIMADGKRKHVLEPSEVVLITKSEHTTKLICTEKRNFFDVLREKLSD